MHVVINLSLLYWFAMYWLVILLFTEVFIDMIVDSHAVVTFIG